MTDRTYLVAICGVLSPSCPRHLSGSRQMLLFSVDLLYDACDRYIEFQEICISVLRCLLDQIINDCCGSEKHILETREYMTERMM
jgi:hypothetical protein